MLHSTNVRICEYYAVGTGMPQTLSVSVCFIDYFVAVRRTVCGKEVCLHVFSNA